MDGRHTNDDAVPSSRGSRATAAAAAALAIMAVAMASGTASGDETAAAAERSGPRWCPDDGCAAARCPRGRDACPLGLVSDGCGCCPYGVCGLGETAECNAADRPCADDLECVVTVNGGQTETAAMYRCACKVKEPACGSDNKTYSNPCQLNEAANQQLANNGITLSIQYRGPCQSAPLIRSVPKKFAGSVGQPVVFDCEVQGYPVPSISWKFTDTSGINKWLPGDDPLIAIQTRGGPDHLTVTSWVQIMDFKPNHAGNYTCLGTNSVDNAMATAELDIRKMT